jgi:hypothetical protein
LVPCALCVPLLADCAAVTSQTFCGRMPPL